MQANVLTPPMFIAQEPQIPSRQERLNVRVGSNSFLIFIRASRTIGPQLKKKKAQSIKYKCKIQNHKKNWKKWRYKVNNQKKNKKR